jgi:carbonic anhydrase
MSLTPRAVIEDLLSGNKRFLDGKSIKSTDSSLKKLKDFAKSGQLPKAIILCCSDSRAPVEMIFDQDIGDLFVIRVAGNIVAPSLVGSVEFAASAFGTNLVLVMGHSQCGAIKATLDYIENGNDISTENIHDIVGRIRPHIFQISKQNDISKSEKLELAVEANVRASVSQLEHSSRLIEKLVHDEQIEVIGAILDLNTGMVRLID